MYSGTATNKHSLSFTMYDIYSFAFAQYNYRACGQHVLLSIIFRYVLAAVYNMRNSHQVHFGSEASVNIYTRYQYFVVKETKLCNNNYVIEGY